MPYIICTTCKKRFFGDGYLSLEDLQEDIVEHIRVEHGIELQPDPELTWSDILKMCSIPREIPAVE